MNALLSNIYGEQFKAQAVPFSLKYVLLELQFWARLLECFTEDTMALFLSKPSGRKCLIPHTPRLSYFFPLQIVLRFLIIPYLRTEWPLALQEGVLQCM